MLHTCRAIVFIFVLINCLAFANSEYSNIESIITLLDQHDYNGIIEGSEIPDEEYAFCVNNKQLEIQNTNVKSIFGPFYKFAIEEDTVSLPCSPCSYTSRPLPIWMKLSFENAKTKIEAENSEKFTVSPDDSLIINSINSGDFGIFYCMINEHVGYIWSLEPESYEHLQIVPARTWGKSSDTQDIAFPDFSITTQFESWSPCSKCHYVGKRHRFGYCYVQILTNDFHENNTETEILPFKSFYAYPNGLSCKLFLLLHPDLNLEIRRALIIRGPYLMLSFCKIQCETLDFIPQTLFNRLNFKLRRFYQNDLKELIEKSELHINFDKRMEQHDNFKENIFAFIPSRAPTSFEWFLLISLACLQLYILIHVCRNRAKAK